MADHVTCANDYGKCLETGKRQNTLSLKKRHWRGAPNNLLDVQICICLKCTALDSEGFSICRSIGYGHFNGSLKKDGPIPDSSKVSATYSNWKLLTQKIFQEECNCGTIIFCQWFKVRWRLSGTRFLLSVICYIVLETLATRIHPHNLKFLSTHLALDMSCCIDGHWPSLVAKCVIWSRWMIVWLTHVTCIINLLELASSYVCLCQ